MFCASFLYIPSLTLSVVLSDSLSRCSRQSPVVSRSHISKPRSLGISWYSLLTFFYSLPVYPWSFVLRPLSTHPPTNLALSLHFYCQDPNPPPTTNAQTAPSPVPTASSFLLNPCCACFLLVHSPSRRVSTSVPVHLPSYLHTAPPVPAPVSVLQENPRNCSP